LRKVKRLNSCRIFALKGNIIFTKTSTRFAVVSRGYIICEDGIVIDVYEKLPERYKNIEVTDYGDRLIIPGLVDLHVHAPQFAYRGLGMDLELLAWLETYAFKEEAKYEDTEYARSAYEAFCGALKKSATTHAAVFATLHTGATRLLMDLLEETGLCTFVGKVNMDRNSPAYLTQTTEESISDTEEWLAVTRNQYDRTKPILTPRFVPTCSDKLMAALGKMARDSGVPVQSHLSENRAEIDWVKKLHPDCGSYGAVYDKYGLFGRNAPTIMAHCVYPTEGEIELIRTNGVMIAHCPQSNTNISSGIAPVRAMLDRGLKIGLGTDVAGGFSLSIFRAMTDAIQVSKLRAVLLDQTKKPLSMPEAFYMATKGGGAFWGKVGSFEPGYELSAVVLDDENIGRTGELTVEQRLERIVYLSTDEQITAKYACGKLIKSES
jgi:guanine deaminase